MRRFAPAQARVLQDFEGIWQFERTALHASGDRAEITGRAVFAPCAEGLLYEETGQMSINGGPAVAATQSYVWRDGLRVYFSDGRFFHMVPATGGDAHHTCPPDDYRVMYDFSNWPVWQSVWTVSGPRKDYRMETRFWRI